jgi:hypothetical protein
MLILAAHYDCTDYDGSAASYYVDTNRNKYIRVKTAFHMGLVEFLYWYIFWWDTGLYSWGRHGTMIGRWKIRAGRRK